MGPPKELPLCVRGPPGLVECERTAVSPDSTPLPTPLDNAGWKLAAFSLVSVSSSLRGSFSAPGESGPPGPGGTGLSSLPNGVMRCRMPPVKWSQLPGPCYPPGTKHQSSIGHAYPMAPRILTPLDPQFLAAVVSRGDIG